MKLLLVLIFATVFSFVICDVTNNEVRFSVAGIAQTVRQSLHNASLHAPDDDDDDDSPDEALNDYFRDVLDGFRQVMPTGSSSLDLPVLDPLRLDRKEWRYANDNSRLAVDFTDAVVAGMSTFDVAKLDVDLRHLRIALVIHVPELTANGFYKLNGVAIYVLPLRGEGRWEASVRNLTVSADVQLEYTERREVRLRMLSLVGDVGQSSLNLENLLGKGNLGQVVRGIVQTNSRRIIGTAIAALRSSLEELMADYTDVLDADLIVELRSRSFTDITSN